MRGILLAGGYGTRLYPLTKVINKHLLPVCDKPMIYYPLSTLMLAGIQEILVITNTHQIGMYEELLGDGSQWGIQLSYLGQEKPQGIAEALILAEEFIAGESCCLILGDNIFHGSGLADQLQRFNQNQAGATVFAYYVDKPQDYGVITFDKDQKAIKIQEKPQNPESNFAITGLYFYDSNAVSLAKTLKPSARGELEISDLNQLYLEKNQLSVELFGRGFTWLDMGTHTDLIKAANYVNVIEERQGLKIGSPEEVAFRMGFTNSDQLISLADEFTNNSYGRYLMSLIQ